MAKAKELAPAAARDTRMAIPSHLHPLSFVARLEWRLEHQPPRQKGQRTRERLKLAGARLLMNSNLHDIRTGDFSAEAGMAEGSFYLYFTDKADLVRTVLDEFQTMFFDLNLRRARHEQGDEVESIRFANLVWISFARANGGLIRSLYQFADGDPQFARTFQAHNMRWHQRVLRGLMRQGGPITAMGEDELLLIVCVLGGMMDDLIRKLFVQPDAELVTLLDRLDATDETIADVATVIWMRLLAPGQAPLLREPSIAGRIAAAIVNPAHD